MIEEIGRGGMGVVYRARQTSLNRQVAVKMLLAGGFADEEFARRFQAEAEAAAGLQHPNIVAIHEIGEHEGVPYFCMDYVAGPSLAEVVRDGPLAPERAARYVELVAQAIHHAHECRILHRDLKPSNILIDPSDQPAVTDFGLAKRLDAAADELTVSHQLLGSVNYMPPEQAFPKWGKLGVHSDVYSLGAVLYHLLTGQPPFAERSFAETLVRIQTHDPTPPRRLNAKVPLELEAICMKCLAKRPSERYPSALALAEDLQRWQAGRPVEARPVGLLTRLWRWGRREPWAAATIALVSLFLVAVAGRVALPNPEPGPVTASPGEPPAAGPDMAQASVVALPPTPEPRRHVAAAWFQGRLHVLGGEIAPCQPGSDYFVFDPREGRWTHWTDGLLTPRAEFAAVAAGGRLYAVGVGRCGHRLPEVERFDPGTGQWQSCAPMPKPLRYPAVASAGGRNIHVLGGLDSQSRPNHEHFVYDTELDVWKRGPAFPNLLDAPQAVPWCGAVVLGDILNVLVRSTAVRNDYDLFGCWLPRSAWMAHGQVPLPEGTIWQHPSLVRCGSDLAVVADHVIDGRLPILFYRPRTRHWERASCAAQPLDDHQSIRIVAAGSDFYLLGHREAPSAFDTLGRLALGGSLLPQIVAHPVGGVADEGGKALLKARAIGPGPLSLQWLRNGRPVAGATSAELRVARASFADAGLYQLRVSNAHGTVTSAPARLVVAPSADLNAFPVVYLTESRDLWLCDRFGTNHVPLLLTGDCFKPTWSPRGDWILFLRGDREAWCVRPDGKDLHRAAAGAIPIGEPVWIATNRFAVCTVPVGLGAFVQHAVDVDGGLLRQVWAPTNGPVWGWSWDCSPRSGRLGLSAAERNWTPSKDIYAIQPASWSWRLLWSDAEDDHEDYDPRWAARTDRLAWTHSVEPGLSSPEQSVGILDLSDSDPSPGWVSLPAGRGALLDWTDRDELLVLDRGREPPRLCVLDDQGTFVREIPVPQRVLDARWDKWGE